MCFSVISADFWENRMKFLCATKKGREFFAFKDSNVDEAELPKVCFTESSLEVMRNVHSILQWKLE